MAFFNQPGTEEKTGKGQDNNAPVTKASGPETPPVAPGKEELKMKSAPEKAARQEDALTASVDKRIEAARSRVLELQKQRRRILDRSAAQKRNAAADVLVKLGNPLTDFLTGLDAGKIEVGDKTAAQVLEQLLEEARKAR